MRTTDEQVNEVFRRAALLRARRLRRKKILLGVCCFALSFHLILLLKGRISMTVQPIQRRTDHLCSRESATIMS